MDRPAYSLPVIHQITQLSSTLESVITLGHKAKQPLIRRSSELVDGLEPHAMFYLVDTARPLPPVLHRVRGGVYPGWCREVGTGRVVYRVPSHSPAGQIEAYL